MDYQNINKTQADRLLKGYWAGESSLEEEAALRQYFQNGDIAEKHQQFAPLFGYFQQAQQKQKVETKLTPLKTQSAKAYRSWLSIAASVALIISAAYVFWQEPQNQLQEGSVAVSSYSAEKQATFEEAKAALLLVSNKINKGNKKAIKELKSIRK